jgi:hypothetical protein
MASTGAAHGFEGPTRPPRGRYRGLAWRGKMGANRGSGRRNEAVTGPEHYRKATQLMQQASRERCELGCKIEYCEHLTPMYSAANVHATLALAAATATQASHIDDKDWDRVFRR